MDWLLQLFTNLSSPAHVVFLYAAVIVLGYKFGKIKIGGVSLGTTFVLFIGILVGHFYNFFGLHTADGYACPADTLNFIQNFGLILFVYCIGLQVGPGFFSSFKEGGVKLNLLSASIVLLNIAVMFGLYLLFFDTSNPKNLPMMVGVLCGAVTNTPGLGAANETLSELFISHPALKEAMSGNQIASAYACAYPLGVVGMIGATIFLRYFLRISLKKEEEEITKLREANPHARPHHMTIIATNKALEGKSLFNVGRFLGRTFVCTRMEHNGVITQANNDTCFSVGDKMRIVCAEDDAEAITAFLGDHIDMDWNEDHSPIVAKRIVITRQEIEGKTFGDMHFNSVYGVNITRFTRSGMDLYADRNLRLQIGDRLMAVGSEENITRVSNLVGNSEKNLTRPNIAPIFIGIIIGIVLGSYPLSVSGLPFPVKLGIAGGPLITAILIGRFGYKIHLVSYTTTSVNLFIRELGLTLFLASVGIKAGAGFWDTIIAGDGLKYVWTGFIITVIPILIIGIMARLRYKLNYFTLMGLIAGSNTDPPLLGFSNDLAGNDAPAVSYSTVYPLAMFLRILTAQLIILFCTLM